MTTLLLNGIFLAPWHAGQEVTEVRSPRVASTAGLHSTQPWGFDLTSPRALKDSVGEVVRDVGRDNLLFSALYMASHG